MEWQQALVLILGSVLILMLTGIPVAFAFIIVNVIGVFLFWGGLDAFGRLVGSMFSSVAIFSLLPIPLFILMGEILLNSGTAPIFIDTIGKWTSRVPGRLSLLTVVAGTLIGALTGVGMASVALMAKIMLPELRKHGYADSMSLGPIVGVGALALMIPPSVPAVILGGLARISIGKILVGIIFPGLMLSALYALYVLIRCKLQPGIAPAYIEPPSALSEKLKAAARDLLPIAFIIFCVTGVIFTGIATPTEAAATGAIACFIVSASYRKLNWGVIYKSFLNTAFTTVMIFMIIVGAITFGQNLAMSGASRGWIQFVTGLPISPITIVIGMALIVIILGMFVEVVGIMMITIPIFAPIITNLGLDPIWWAVAMMMAITIGPISPPFGLDMFTLKGLAPPDVTMFRIYKAATPFCILCLIVLIFILAFPPLATWLPSLVTY